jgi:hypothetical protein
MRSRFFIHLLATDMVVNLRDVQFLYTTNFMRALRFFDVLGKGYYMIWHVE